jgi:hypothetical protein
MHFCHPTEPVAMPDMGWTTGAAGDCAEELGWGGLLLEFPWRYGKRSDHRKAISWPNPKDRIHGVGGL